LFSNGWVVDEDRTVFIYYASSDTRLHVATTTVERLLDYCQNTAADGFTSAASVATLVSVIDKNKQFSASQKKEINFSHSKV
jgi:4-O-beta-D-mannosyl-D-glucose phosphorylase